MLLSLTLPPIFQLCSFLSLLLILFFSLSAASLSGFSAIPSHVLIPITANQTYNISLHFSEIPPDNSTLSLIFLSPATLTTETGQMLMESSLSAHLYSYPSNVLSALSAVAAAASKGSVTAVTVISFITGSPTTLFGLISQLQLVTYIPLLSVDMPQGIIDAMAGLNSNALVFSPFQGIVSSNSPAATPSDLPQRYGFSSTLFLSNSSFTLLGAFGLLLSYPCVSLLSQLTVVPVVAIYFRQVREQFKWNYPVQWWMQVYMDVGVGALLQFSTLTSYNQEPILLLNACIAGLFLAAFGMSPFLVIRLLGNGKKKPLAGFGVLYAGLKPEVRLYFPLYFFRRLLYAVVLLEFGNYPAFQAISSALISSVMLAYLVLTRPYASLAGLASPIIAEITATSSLALVSLFLLIPQGSDYGKRVEQAVLGVVLGGVGACGLLALCQLFATGKEVVTTFRRIAKELKSARFKSTFPNSIHRSHIII